MPVEAWWSAGVLSWLSRRPLPQNALPTPAPERVSLPGFSAGRRRIAPTFPLLTPTERSHMPGRGLACQGLSADRRRTLPPLRHTPPQTSLHLSGRSMEKSPGGFLYKTGIEAGSGSFYNRGGSSCKSRGRNRKTGREYSNASDSVAGLCHRRTGEGRMAARGHPAAAGTGRGSFLYEQPERHRI